MVETHKTLLARRKSRGKTLFLDTPAGFQGNVDLIARRAAQYFAQHVLHHMEIASFKSAQYADFPESEKVFHLLSEANYVLIGPGSPTYTVRQLKETPIPALLNAMVTRGGCLTVASAAALTVGSHTLPVYEIYKVGEAPHWMEGLNILGRLGLEVVVIPHWNNAEGGNHDTRFCYMGEKRFQDLENLLPFGATILGLDEHTACILDFSTQEAEVEGLGRVVIRRGGVEKYFTRGEKFTFQQLRGDTDFCASATGAKASSPVPAPDLREKSQPPFWERMHAIETAFHKALEEIDAPSITNLLLEADSFLWQAQLDLENPEFISQGRELYREMIVLAGTGLSRTATTIPQQLGTLVEALLELREQHRQQKKWPQADQIRTALQNAGIIIEDTRQGPRWRLRS